MPLLPRRPSDRSLLRGLMALYFGLAVVLAAFGALLGDSSAVLGAVAAVSALICFGLLVTTLGVYGLAWLLHRNSVWRQERRTSG